MNEADCSNTETVDLDKIRRIILHWLTRRDYTQLEISQKLIQKGYSSDLTQPVITRLLDAGLINETRFTESFIHWRRNKGHGPLRILAELKARGIHPEMIAKHLDIADNAWFAEAKKSWQKHFKGKQPCDFATRAKQMRFLQYRGFTREQIENVLKTTY